MPQLKKNHSLKDLNSFHFDVLAETYCECKSASQVRDLIRSGIMQKTPYLILGEGSNILFTGDFKGLILRPLILGREILREDREHVWIRAGGGENWDDFVAWTTAWGYGGIENLSLIPGSVGSSPIQNIGAYGVEVESVIEEVEALDVLDGNRLLFKNESCRFAYRDSIFKRDWKNKCIITSVVFRLDKIPRLNLNYGMVAERMESMQADRSKNEVERLRDVIIDIRRSKLPDPDELGNAGSFFKNPVLSSDIFEQIASDYPGIPSYPAPGGNIKIPAAWLIEQCGWKGRRIGDAGSYEKQPLVLVNYGNSSGAEMLDLAGNIVAEVQKKFRIRLEKEVNIV